MHAGYISVLALSGVSGLNASDAEDLEETCMPVSNTS